MKKLFFALIALLSVLTSCSNDDDKEPQNTSRTLRYELTGNFSGSNIIAVYTTASGGTVTEQIASFNYR